MITKFKIFENHEKFFYDLDDLTALLTQKFIEDYYEDHWEVDFEEDVANALNLWNYVNTDDVTSYYIRMIADDTSLDNKKFKKEDYITYIEGNIITRKDIDITKEDLKKMSINELIELISDTGEETEFLVDYFESEYAHSSPEELLYVIYGKNAVRDSNFYTYLKDFINEEELIEDYKRRVEFETKLGYIQDFICKDEELQRKLLDLNPNTAEALFNEMDANRSIGTEYNFQKTYIEVVIKHLDFDDQDELDDIISEELKQIDEKFGLNPKIIKDYPKEYKEYRIKKDSDKYNL